MFRFFSSVKAPFINELLTNVRYKWGMASAKQHIHIIEDEHDIAKLMEFNLGVEGFDVSRSANGADGLKFVQTKVPDLVLLDLMLPGMDGPEVCRHIKANPSVADIPIIMVTAKGEEDDIVRGLELGADDYITKPFSPQILIARVKAVLRRADLPEKTDQDVLKIHELVIHPGRHEVMIEGVDGSSSPSAKDTLDLTHSEFKILHFLARRPGWVFTRAQIVDAIRGDNYVVTDR